MTPKIPEFATIGDADAWADPARKLTQISEALAILDGYTWGDLGGHMTCPEANAMIEVLNLLDRADLAAYLIEGHEASDTDPEDMHHRKVT